MCPRTLASKQQNQTFAPTLGFQVHCPFSYTTLAMLPYLNMIPNYTIRQFFDRCRLKILRKNLRIQIICTLWRSRIYLEFLFFSHSLPEQPKEMRLKKKNYTTTLSQTPSRERMNSSCS